MSENETNIHRRSVLALAGVMITGTSGCLGFLGFGDDDSDPEGTSSDGGEDGPQEDSTPTENESDTRPQSDNETAENQTGANETDQNDTQENTENESSEGQDQSEGEERQPTPSESDTEIDRDQYNQTEQREVTDRPQSHVSVTVGVSRATDNTITVSGKVTNISDEPIDFVDVEVVYLDDTGSSVGTGIDTVRDLESGASKAYKVSTNPVTLRGEVAEVKVDPYPQDNA